VLIVSGEGTVESLDRMLRRRGVAVTRRTLLRRVPVPSGRLRSELDRFERPEVCLLTSPEGARSLGRLGFLRDRPGGVRLEVLAGGPATAREARRWGARRIRNGTGRGAEVARYLHGHRPRPDAAP
jgi:uroporphyrinogen-III synthase